MTDLQLNKDWRYKRQEHFWLSPERLIPFNFGGNEYLVYDNVNLSIFADEYCNGDCDFCVARLRYENAGAKYVKPKLPVDAYLRQLEKVLETVAPLRPSISITGGEPTLCPHLPQILDVLESFNLRKKTITTNGSGLLKITGTGESLLEQLARYGIAHLNISRAHHNETRNASLMKMNGSGLSNTELETLMAAARPLGIRPRLSCVLVRGEVETLNDAIEYLEWAKSIQVDNVVFRQLIQYDTSKVTRCRAADFHDKNTIDLEPLWEQIDNDSRFSFLQQVLGYYYYVEVYRFGDIDMVTEAANLGQIPVTRSKMLKTTDGIPVVYEMVYHPNGTLCGSWREWEEVLIQ